MRSHGRTRGRRWLRLRSRILSRDPVCVLCRTLDRTCVSVVVDHIVPLAHGGTDDESNLRGLCAACHDEVTRQQFGYREKKAFGADGMPADGEWS
ncbi:MULTISPECIES: HNH endonuclease signature motif containing protein [unclassified Caballeronia]|uniref:HNH endonuclease n=1 Tax=unclassified Caballeronia TaxID=2646786 RepID=UPI00285DF107|nr:MULTISPECIES: HNH endonuclease signature motif containing protein [unclassified Caballeronia]MDR5776531.1 HNH endonuclease signature motif containing protein [Caballeronia sp. LZ002]MDR5803461.1 HNH endonuclease signature motif containing protein [Caballeronia sp. LZ001]MDR5851966.1 HNH endonuclease signature motif containing protein [Caballeronia sp. LZ003]